MSSLHAAITLGIFGITTGTINSILSRYGYAAVFVFVGIESTGIPFPGETMLLAAAVYSGMGHLSLLGVIIAAAAGAILGDNLGYAAGRSGGHALVERYGKYLHLRPEHLARAEEFFRKYGDRTVFFGRFVAVLRTWAAFLAGVNQMPWHKFLLFNAAGGIVWATLYGVLGYVLGDNLPLLHQVTRIIGVGGVIAAVVVIVAIGVVWWRRSRRRAEKGDQESQSAAS
jgi:membrane protein DedA with SNARE-associated domain